MVGLTPTFRTKVPILMVNSGSDMGVYNATDGFLGLGSRNNAGDFIDQAFKDGFIEVYWGIICVIYSSIGENILNLYGLQCRLDHANFYLRLIFDTWICR